MESGYLYDYIHKSILDDIGKGSYKSGDVLPSEKQLCKKYDVSLITVRRALKSLEDKNVIYKVKGKGSIVNANIRKSEISFNKNIGILDLDLSGLRDIQYPDVPFNSQIYNQNDWKNVIYTSIYNKLSSEYNIILGTYERKELIENFDTTIFKNIQRIFIMGLYNKGLIDFLHSKGKLVVVYNNFDKSLNTCSVSTDERNKAKLIVDHLIKIGHKKIAAINGDMNFSESIERSMGFQEALMKNSVPVELSMIKWGNMTSESGYHLAKQILSGKEKPTAIVCVNDNVASGALFAAKEIGLSCPKDISIVGHDFNSLLHEHTDPIITSISPQYELVGEKISEKLIRDIWFDDSTIVEGKLALTESIAPPPIKAP